MQVSSIVILALAIGLTSSASLSAPTNTITRALAPIDDFGQFQAEWIINIATGSVRFNLVVATTGFVGFGFSPNGTMAGADLVIGGVYDADSRSYFSDRHGTGYVEPPIDSVQNYELQSAIQNATHTSLGFERLLNTGDATQDVVLRNETVNIIWSYGPSDVVEYHRGDRGVFVTNLFSP